MKEQASKNKMLTLP